MITGGGGTFVGRERELEVVLAAGARAASGRAASLLIEASSGMGATRLLDEATALLGGGRDPITILRTDALPAWRGAPYAPFRVALERLLVERPPADASQILGSAAETLLPLLPAVAARLPDAPVTAPIPRERVAERIQEAVRRIVVGLAADGPVVLVVEDLHVLDAASRSLLAFLARTVGERPIAIVGSYQPDALGRAHPLRALLEAIDTGPRPAARLPLDPLDGPALRDLIIAHEGEAPSAPVLLLVAERSGGIPLLAEEILVARRELSGASLAVPLEQLVVGRAARRSPECRRVLRILAVADGQLNRAQIAAVAAAYDAEIGHPAPRSQAALSRRAGAADGDILAGVAEAIAHGFVEIAGDGAGTRRSTGRAALARSRVDRGRPLRIRHELIAGALEADLLPASRRRMHASIAAALPSHSGEAGRHWHRAHEARRELLAEIDAAAEAERIGAAADALAHLERAIELSGAPAVRGAIDDTAELDLLSRAAEASHRSGDAGRAIAFIESALARQPDRRDRVARSALVERLAAYQWAGGDHDGAVVSYERAIELLPVAPGVAWARLLATIAQVRMLEGSYTDAERLADEAIEVAAAAEGAEAGAWRGHALCTLGVVDGWLGHPERGIARLQEALAIAVELDRPDDAFRARANLSTALELRGDREAAVDVALRGIAAAEAAGLEVVHGNVLRANAADGLISLGRWGEARTLAERALDWAPSGVPFVMAALSLAIVETETAAADAAAQLLGRLYLEIETVPYVELAVPVYQAAASFALWRGDIADAMRAIDAGWERVRTSEEWALAARLAAAALAVADARVVAARTRSDIAGIAAARAWSDEIRREAARMVAATGAPEGTWMRREVDADLAVAAAYAARIRGHDDPEAWSAVASRWEELQRPYEQARALYCELEALLERPAAVGGRRESRLEARELVEQACGIAVGLGAMPLLRALADIATRARITLPAAAATALEAAAASRAAAIVDEGPVAPPAGRRDPARPDRPTTASFGLSPREQGVLAEIVAGRTNREIGERLFISDKTVGVHVGNILAKLGVSGRVEAATVALRLGLVAELVESAKKPGPRGPGSVGRRRGGVA